MNKELEVNELDELRFVLKNGYWITFHVAKKTGDMKMIVKKWSAMTLKVGSKAPKYREPGILLDKHLSFNNSTSTECATPRKQYSDG